MKVVLLECAVDVLAEGTVLRRVRAVVVVEFDQEAGEIARVLVEHPRDQLLRGNSFLLGTQHDRRAVGVVGADVVHLVPAQALEAHPDIGLDVLDQVAKMDRSIGVGQGGRYEEAARHSVRRDALNP